jgi:hypothetical protein
VVDLGVLAFRPEVVELPRADERLRAELTEAGVEPGKAYFERFVTSIVDATRPLM